MVLGIEGGPRHAGTTAKMMDELTKEIASTGRTVEIVRLRELDLAPCQGCLVCRKKGACVIQDDLQKIHEKLDAADALVISSPTYWGNMTSPLKCLFDRSVFKFESFSAFIPRPLQKGKKAIILTSCASPYPLSQLRKHGGGTVRSIRTVLASAGYSVVGTMIKPGTDKNSELSSKEVRKVRRMARRL